MAKLAQGTEVFVLLPKQVGTGLEVVRITCATSFNPGGQPADKIEDTCLEETSTRTYMKGLRTPATASLGLNPDPGNQSHYRLYLETEGTQDVLRKWAIGWSDGTAAPTINVAGDDFVLPDSRTWLTFEGFPADFPFDFQTNALVTGAVPIERSGPAVWVPKEPEA